MIGSLVMVAVMILFWLIMYVYLAICLQKLAKRTGTTPAWLAWIPIISAFLMLKIAQKPMWWFILFFIPVANIIAGVIIWMKIAERVGKENWIGILILAPVIGIAIPGYLAFSGNGQKKTELSQKEPEFIGGSKEADKPAVGYKHPCKYCEKLVNPDSAVCPFCGKAAPLGPDRCPKCKNPIEKTWKTCAHCGLNLRIVCPFCGKVTFFGDYCEDCQKELKVVCPYCQFEQPPLDNKCIKCEKSLEKPANEK
jgi:RNA polymerase subunit RPABC4/transcription elongation factor Spt4